MSPERKRLSGQAPETEPVEIKKFSDESREALEKEGYVIVELTGQSISSHREKGNKFSSKWHEGNPNFEALTSMQSEVAINPNQLFLPDSNNKTLEQQEEMTGKFSQKLGENIPGVKAIMGSAADNIDLAFTYLDTTGDYLFGKDHNYNYARTKQPTVGAFVADVGCFDLIDGLDVYAWDCGNSSRFNFVAPLVVPA